MKSLKFFPLFIAGLWGGLVANARTIDSGTCGANLSWKLTDDWVITISGIGEMTDYDSSSERPWDFWSTEIKNAFVESGVTSIGSYAFLGCINLSSITIPESIKEIGNGAFWDCTGELIVNCNIPDTKNSRGAFEGSKFSRITIGEGVTSIGYNAFHNCSSIVEVCVNSIEDWCNIEFSENNHSSISNPLFYAEKFLVDGKQVQNLTIPSTVNTIKDHAFHGFKGIEALTVSKDVKAIGFEAFRDCNNLKTVAISEGKTSIGSNAFIYCKGLLSATIGGASIGDDAFYECSNLSSLTLLEGVGSIGEGAFSDCSCLKSITIPSSLTTIGYSAFEGCNLSSVHINDLESWCGIEFDYADDPDCNPLVNAGNLYLNGDLVTNAVLKSKPGFTAIKEGAFMNYRHLTSISVPEGVKEINMDAFNGCTNLKSISLPNSLENIGSRAFKDCDIKKVYITDIASWCGINMHAEDNPLYNSASLYLGDEILSELTIPEMVSIPDYRFSNCKDLKYVTILGLSGGCSSNVFNGCSNVEELYVYGGLSPVIPSEKLTTIKLYEDSYLPAIHEDFPETVYENATLYVSENLVSQCEFHSFWGKFEHIKGFDVNQNVPISAIKLNKTSATLLQGESLNLIATVSPGDATDKTVRWSSSNNSIATVSNGVVTAVSKGTTTITAKAGSKTATCTITVTEIPVSSITLNKTSATLVKGETLALSATVNPSNATDKTITWSSSNNKVATVNYNGVVTAVSKGSVTITAEAGGKTATCSITVKTSSVDIPVDNITLNETWVTLAQGESLTLEAIVSPSDATDSTVEWFSNDPRVATVNSNGKITAERLGVAVITAKAGDKTATCTVVVDVAVESITLDQTLIKVGQNEYVCLTATVEPEGAATITWSSSDENIASVVEWEDNECFVYAKAGGEATITARAGNKTATCTIIVKGGVAISDFALNITSATIAQGETLALETVVKPSNAYIEKDKLYWSSDNKWIASVDQQGVVTGHEVGEVLIYAEYQDLRAYCIVKVTEGGAVSGLSLNYSSLEFYRNTQPTLVASVTPSYPGQQEPYWSVENENIVSISRSSASEVKLHARSAGTTVITAEVNGFKATCTVTVIFSAGQIESASQLRNDYAYNVQQNSGTDGWYVKDERNELALAGWPFSDDITEESRMFSFVTADNGLTYYLYHPQKQKFINKNGLLTDEAVDPIYLTENRGQFIFNFGDDYTIYWSGDDLLIGQGKSQWKIYAVMTVDTTDALSKLGVSNEVDQLMNNDKLLIIYDLSGRKIVVEELDALSKGLYLINGKKVVID